jgi:hypothetical protein
VLPNYNEVTILGVYSIGLLKEEEHKLMQHIAAVTIGMGEMIL